LRNDEFPTERSTGNTKARERREQRQAGVLLAFLFPCSPCFVSSIRGGIEEALPCPSKWNPFFVAAFYYWNNTFYVIGRGSKTGMSLIRINPYGWEVRARHAN